ncbi:MAG: electron transport complex subunit RsxG [Rhodocyclaceae bacterium]|jgi:electron transport complex protein RnfG|nr:electron transport complex subunit RsxG [Rhodocyclaceae bacterium]
MSIAKSVSLDALRPTLGFQSATLAISVAVATAILALIYGQTKDPIAQAQAQDTINSLAQVLPEGSYDNDVGADTLKAERNGKPVVVHLARKAGGVTAVVLELTERGYSGEIGMVVGINREGFITGVRVTRHTETPGLGDKIERAKGDWVLAFEGKGLDTPSANSWAVKKDGGIFDQFAGATITPRAVVKGVKGGLELFAHQKDTWLASPPPAGH